MNLAKQFRAFKMKKGHQEILDAINSTRLSMPNICELVIMNDGRVLIGNGGGYLITAEEAQSFISNCTEYLKTIDPALISEYNAALLAFRQSENNKPWKEKHVKKERVETYVYLMHNERNGYYKIGRAKDPSARERTLQAEDPQTVIIHTIKGYTDLELEFHKKFGEKRVRGEWFALTTEDVEYIKSLIIKDVE